MITRWCVVRVLPNGIKTLYTVDTEVKAKQLAQQTKESYSNSRVFVGYEIELSHPAETED